MELEDKQLEEKRERRNWLILLLLALFLSCSCVFLSTNLALFFLSRPRMVDANLLALSEADYGPDNYQTRLPALNPSVVAIALTDEAALQLTPPNNEPGNGGTPIALVTTTPIPSSSATTVPPPATAVPSTNTPTPSVTVTPIPTTASPTATATATASTTATQVNFLTPSPTTTPTLLPASTATSTPPIASPSRTPTPIPASPIPATTVPPSTTIPPTPTATPVSPTGTPTFTPVPPTLTATPVLPTVTSTFTPVPPTLTPTATIAPATPTTTSTPTLPPPTLTPTPPLATSTPTPTPTPTPSREVLLVVADPGALDSTDTSVQNRFVSLRFTVILADDNTVVVADSLNREVVYISDSVNEGALGATLCDARAPVIVAKTALYDEMNMTAPGNNSSEANQTNIDIIDPAHPMAAGLSGAVQLLTGNNNIGWGITQPGAQQVATIAGDPSRITIFAYPASANITCGALPVRRVGFPLATGAALTLDGWRLFDAAVNWIVP